MRPFFFVLAMLNAGWCVAADLVPQRYLLPVYSNGQDVIGGGGIRWRVRLSGFNAGAEDVELGPCTAGYPGGAACPPVILRLPARLALIDPMIGWTAAGPQGRLVYFDRVFRDNVKLSLMLLRNDEPVASLPVVDVEALRGASVNILGVPISDQSSTLLRIYEVNNHAAVLAHVSVFSEPSEGSNDRAVASWTVTLQQSPYVDPGGTPYAPAYGELQIPRLNVSSRQIRIEITPEAASDKLWAFVSVTNANDRAVVIIRPAE